MFRVAAITLCAFCIFACDSEEGALHAHQADPARGNSAIKLWDTRDFDNQPVKAVLGRLRGEREAVGKKEDVDFEYMIAYPTSRPTTRSSTDNSTSGEQDAETKLDDVVSRCRADGIANPPRVETGVIEFTGGAFIYVRGTLARVKSRHVVTSAESTEFAIVPHVSDPNVIHVIYFQKFETSPPATGPTRPATQPRVRVDTGGRRAYCIYQHAVLDLRIDPRSGEGQYLGHCKLRDATGDRAIAVERLNRLLEGALWPEKPENHP